MDSILLNKKIEEVGIKRKKLAEKLNLTYSGFRLKALGTNEFKAVEIAKLSELLKLSTDEERKIFFTQ